MAVLLPFFFKAWFLTGKTASAKGTNMAIVKVTNQDEVVREQYEHMIHYAILAIKRT